MAIKSKKRHTRYEHEQLDKLASFKPIDVQGERFLFVNPKAPIQHFADFDKQICAAGLKRYLRKIVPSDFPEHLVGSNTHVVVEELKPGIRIRKAGQLLAPWFTDGGEGN